MPSCPTSSVTKSTLSGFTLMVVILVEEVCPEWFLYLQEVYTFIWQFTVCILYYCTTPAPPTPTNVTIRLQNASSVKLSWQWTSTGPAPNCFNVTHVTYRPEGGDESSLQLSDPAATEATLTNLQDNTCYTVSVVAIAGHKRECVARTVLLPLQGILQGVSVHYVI